jgi:RHS repeat-associated protein
MPTEILNDFLHSYTWDANGRPVTIDGVSVTYDAQGRMVEQNKGGVYSEITYAPTGTKLQIMSGQSPTKQFAPLPGGAVAVWTGGIIYYRHPDHLGSSRFASTGSRTMYYDGAYAPFGEPYAQTGTTDLSFTGMNQDTVAGLYDFPAREYGIQGRWPSPDPAGVAATCTKSPQSQNRYAYVRNNPLTRVDPSGMFDVGPCDPDDPFCGNPCFWDPFFCRGPLPPPGGGGGGGGGFVGGGDGEPKPRAFPWPLIPPGFFNGLGDGTNVLQLSTATCTVTPRGYELNCRWTKPVQTFSASPTAGCDYLEATSWKLGGACANAHEAREGDGSTTRCAPNVTVDKDCHPQSKLFENAKSRLVPPS